MIHRATFVGPIVLLAAAASALAGEKLDPVRLEALAQLLPPLPRGVGRPITDRDAWGTLARLPGYDEIVRRAEKEAAEPFPLLTDELYLDYSLTGNRTRGQEVIFARRARLALLVLAECIDNRRRFLPPIEAAIRGTCAEKSWLLPAHDGGLQNFEGKTIEIDLASSATSWTLATTLYWLGGELGSETQELIERELNRRTFDPYEKHIATGQPRLGWVQTTNNWNAVCHAGVVGAALAVIRPPERRAFFVAAAERFIRYFLDGFTPDGYCSEGLGYWNYGFGHFLLLSETVLQATDGKVDLFADPRVPAISRYASRLEILPGVYPAFADCSTDERPDPRMVAFLGRRFALPGPVVDSSVLQQPTTSLFALGVYAFPNSATDAPAPLAGGEPVPLRDWFPDAGILISRPAPGKERALGVAMKGGHNAEHHNHNDVGSYVVALGGKAPLLDPGSEVYTARTFSSRRYESGVISSFGHPVPRVAGKLQRTGREAEATIVRTDFGESADTLVLDIRSAYAVKELKRLERTFVFSREGPGSLCVTDEVELSEPKEFETALITCLDWRREGKDRLVVGTGPEAVEVAVDADGRDVEVVPEEIHEDVHGKMPIRIGLRLTEPVSRAAVRVTVRPAPRP